MLLVHVHVHVTPVNACTSTYNFACVLACTMYINMWLYVQSTLYKVVKCILPISPHVSMKHSNKNYLMAYFQILSVTYNIVYLGRSL